MKIKKIILKYFLIYKYKIKSYKMDLNLIETILQKKVKSTKDLSIGCDQDVYLIETEDIKYIAKQPRKDLTKIDNEIFAINSLSPFYIPIPKLIYNNNSFLLESYIEGKNLKENYSENYFIELGSYVRKIHEIELEGFGNIIHGKGEYKTELEFLLSYLDYKNNNIVSKNIMKENDIKDITEKNINLFQDKKSFFMHGDIHFGNVIIYKDRINGIIDFGDIVACSIEYDLALFYCKIKNENVWTSFIKGYNKTYREKKFQIYLFVFFIWLLEEKSIESNDIYYNKFLKCLNEIKKY